MPDDTATDRSFPKRRLQSLGIFFGYIALTLLVYGQTLNGGFLVDDWWWAANAKAGGFPLFGENRIFFRPLSSGLFVGEWHLFGANPLGYRIVSLTFLILTAWLIRKIWLTLTNDKQPWVAVTAGALFILWPSHSEAVSWISAFSDLLVVLLGATSLWAYLLYLRRQKTIYAVSTIIVLILALLTKEPAVTLPLIVFALGRALTPKDVLTTKLFSSDVPPFLAFPPLPVRSSPTSPTEGRGLELLARRYLALIQAFRFKRPSEERGFGPEDVAGRFPVRHSNTLLTDAPNRKSSHHKPRTACFDFGVGLFLTLAYLVARSVFLGGHIGGYNGYRLIDVLAALKGWKLTVNLGNLYFPLAKFVAINLSPYAARVSVLTVILGTGAALMRSVGRTKPVTANQKRLLAGLLLAGAVWSILIINDYVLSRIIYLGSYPPFLYSSPLLLALLVYLIANMGRRWWRDVDPFLTERKLSVYWIPAALIVLLLELNRSVLSNLDLLIELSVYAAFLYAIYLSRPLSTADLTLKEDSTLRRVAYAMLFASLVALLPSIALPIDIDGQQGRFSYLGSFFSVIALTAAYAVLLKPFDVRRWATATAAGILFLTAYLNAGEWAQAGAVSRQVTETIKSMLPTRRIYVVAAPDTISAALLFRGGIEEIPLVAGNDPKSKVTLDMAVENMIDGDQLDCKLFSPVIAGVRLQAIHERRLETLRVRIVNDDHLFENSYPLIARLLGFRNKDRAIYIDAEGAHILE